MPVPDPSIDPNRTVDHPASRPSDTVDVSQERSTGATAPYLPTPPADAPTIAGYHITAEIAKGGMGRVYAALDRKFEREVAIKTLLPKANAERFLTEAKITAQLPHPNIPTVYDMGILADGTPYLVMKRIHGRTLAELLASRQQTSSPTLELPQFIQIFEQIAHAVGFAHSRHIVHRDLKPLNVMVGEFGEVQLMDWGLAKNLADPAREGADVERTSAAATDAADNLHHTAAGTIMGTPGYMAPEQARGESVDVRADVFALGSILAAILTGKPAFVGTTSRATITKAASADLTDVLTRLATAPVDVELIHLTKRCLAPERTGRPIDGRAVATEIASYRANVETRLRQAEAEQAAAATRAAETRKRQRALTWAAGIIATVLFAGIIGTTLGMVEANRQTGKAQEEALAKENALKAETAAKDKAEQRLTQIEKGIEIIVRIVKGIDPVAEKKGGDPLFVQLRKNAEQAADSLDAEAVGDPATVARLQSLLGQTLLQLGSVERAVAILEKAWTTRTRELGANHVDTLETQLALANSYVLFGKLPDAMKLVQQVRDAQPDNIDHRQIVIQMLLNMDSNQQPLARKQLELFHREQVQTLGAEHPETLSTLCMLAHLNEVAGQLFEAIKMYEQAYDALMKQTKLPAEQRWPDVQASRSLMVTVYELLPNAYREAGQLEDAIDITEEAIKIWSGARGPDYPDTLKAKSQLADHYIAAGRLPEAIQLHEQVRDAWTKKLGADHPDTLYATSELALAYKEADRLPEALRLLEQVRAAQLKILPAEHHDVLETQIRLARTYADADRHPEALRLLEGVRAIQTKRLGASHAETLDTLIHLAMAYKNNDRLPEALKLLEHVCDGRTKQLGREHQSTLDALSRLAEVYHDSDKKAEAIALREEILRIGVKNMGPDSPKVILYRNLLAYYYSDAGRFRDALTHFEQVRAARVKVLGPDHPDTLKPMQMLAMTHADLGEFAESIKWYEQVRAIQVMKLGANHPDTISTLELLARTYRKAGKFRLAVPLYEAELARTRKEKGASHKETIQVQVDLGVMYCDLKEKDKAVALFREYVAQQRKDHPAGSPAVAQALAIAATPLLKVEQYTMAEEMLRESLAIREKTQPEAWTTFNTMSLLGGAFLGQKKYSDAEPLLLKGYEGIKAREAKIPPQGAIRIAEALDRLLELYTATNKPDEVKKYQERRAKYPAAKMVEKQ